MVAMFQMVGGGIGVLPDPAGNDAGHKAPNQVSGLRISFEVQNGGDDVRNAAVGVEVDYFYLLT